MQERLWKTRLKSHHQAEAPLAQLPLRESSLAEYSSQGHVPQQPGCVYIHVPYCSRTCTFCSMRRAHAVPPEHYADLIIKQIEQALAMPYIALGEYVSVYFGGGTPTVLGGVQLARIIKALREGLRLSPDAEISVESSITDLDDDQLAMLADAGVNRLSIGVQTFADRGRQLLGRKGTGQQVRDRLSAIIESGMRNTGIDLIYTYPGQTADELQLDIEAITELDISGLSCYSLLLYARSALGQRLGVDNDAYSEATLADDLENWSKLFGGLADAGYEMLELTKWVRPGRDEYRYIHVQHGDGDILPLGAAAGGRLGSLLLHNPYDAKEFAALLDLPPEQRYQGRLASDAHSYISRQLDTLQFCYAERDETQPDYGLAFDELADFVTGHELGSLSDGRLTLSGEGVFWGNNIAHRYADALVQLALEKEGQTCVTQ